MKLQPVCTGLLTKQNGLEWLTSEVMRI